MDLSIIIPAYNCKDTLGITLDSICQQNLLIDFEVIVVNDCSDYDYSNFINKYRDMLNIKEIKTIENVGPGGARQFGIDNSSSKYIVFIDSDDCFYDNDSILKMYNAIKKENVDLLIANFIYERDNKRLVKKNDFTWLHGKMYKREFLSFNNIRFNNSRANEDNGFNRLILLLNPKLTFLDEIVYIYKENPKSITRKNNRSYKFNGIEGFCYNMNWAMDGALARKKVENLVGLLSIDILSALYVYYLGLEKEYDVSKILKWGKDIKEKYYKYGIFIDKERISKILESKKEQLKDDMIISNYYITFDEFLEKVGT